MSPEIRLIWGRRTSAEYRSAALASQMLHWCIALGLPPTLTIGLHRQVLEELTHADLSRAVHLAAGGVPEEVTIPREALFIGLYPTESLERRALATALQELTLHEAVALEAFRAMLQAPLVPVVRRTVEQILRDESRHRRHGWRIFEALLLHTGDHAWISSLLPDLLTGVLQGYRTQQPKGELAHTWGLLDQSTYNRAIRRALEGGIARNLARLGLDLPEGIR